MTGKVLRIAAANSNKKGVSLKLTIPAPYAQSLDLHVGSQVELSLVSNLGVDELRIRKVEVGGGV